MIIWMSIQIAAARHPLTMRGVSELHSTLAPYYKPGYQHASGTNEFLRKYEHGQFHRLRHTRWPIVSPHVKTI